MGQLLKEQIFSILIEVLLKRLIGGPLVSKGWPMRIFRSLLSWKKLLGWPTSDVAPIERPKSIADLKSEARKSFENVNYLKKKKQDLLD